MPRSSKRPALLRATRFCAKNSKTKWTSTNKSSKRSVTSFRRRILSEKLDETRASRDQATRWRLSRQWFSPAALAVVFGLILIAGVMVHQTIESRADFPGKEAVAKMIDLCGEMNGTEFEAKRAPVPASQLADTLYMAGFEGFALPEEVAALPAVGWRVFRQQGHRVAQLAIDSREAIVFVFRASDFGVQGGATPAWRIAGTERVGWRIE